MKKLFHVFVGVDGYNIGRVSLREPSQHFEPAPVGEIAINDYYKELRLPDIELDIDVPTNEELTEMLATYWLK